MTLTRTLFIAHENHQESIDAARSVMEDHIRALNARDGTAIAATLHFPHCRLCDGHLKVWETSETYLSDFRKRAGSDWSYSRWGQLEVVHCSDDKVHLDVVVNRYKEGVKLLISFRSLWVVAYIDGTWAARLRSSFAPDSEIIDAEQSKF